LLPWRQPLWRRRKRFRNSYWLFEAGTFNLLKTMLQKLISNFKKRTRGVIIISWIFFYSATYSQDYYPYKGIKLSNRFDKTRFEENSFCGPSKYDVYITKHYPDGAIKRFDIDKTIANGIINISSDSVFTFTFSTSVYEELSKRKYDWSNFTFKHLKFLDAHSYGSLKDSAYARLVEKLIFSSNELTHLSTIGSIKIPKKDSLLCLWISYDYLITNNFGDYFPKLRTLFLHLRETKEQFPEEYFLKINNVTHLEIFCSDSSHLTALPLSICQLKELKELQLFTPKLYFLPDSIGKLKSLEYLRIENSSLKELPTSFKDLSSLKKLLIIESEIQKFPDVLCEMKQLKEIDIQLADIINIPESIVS
jgi:hypothetical protein